MEKRNFYAASIHLKDFYGITMTDDAFENMALHAWDQIGNKTVRTYVYKAKVCNYRIDLPCNLGIIEAVLTDGEDYIRTDGVDNWTANNYNSEVEGYVESWKSPTEFNYSPGRLINHEVGDDALFFKVTDIPVSIIYKGIQVDDKGLPMLNFKEIDAIAKYCAWIQTQKQAFVNKDQVSMQFAVNLQQQWQRACDDARTPIQLNQNDMDTILNASSRWDRKKYNINFKPLL